LHLLRRIVDEHMEIILAIDGGGSRTRCLVIDRRGRILGEGASGPSNHLLVERTVVKQSLADSIDQAITGGCVKREEIACLSAGLAGVDFDGTGAREIDEVFRELGFERAVINGDMVIAHAGALGLSAGVVALSGTGSVILGIGTDGKRVKVGGWGPVYGDEGSAYRIGEMALRAAARAYDGRGPATALTSQVLTALKLKEFRETIQLVYAEGMAPREIASLSRVAYAAAAAGDEVARRIFLQSGEELAEGVKAAINQLEWGDAEVFVSCQGAILESCPLLFERFVETLKHNVPLVSVVPPRFEPVIGAYLLGCRELAWRLDDLVFRSLETRAAAK
jgi:N-acetylglucosamine kinase-like BadF-type ATPase